MQKKGKRPSNPLLQACLTGLIFTAIKARTHATYQRSNLSISGTESVRTYGVKLGGKCSIFTENGSNKGANTIPNCLHIGI